MVIAGVTNALTLELGVEGRGTYVYTGATVTSCK